MGAIAFDTHKFIKTLEKSGFKEEQAEALSTVIKEVNATHLEELATKSDIIEVKQGIKELKLETKLDIAEVKGELRLLKWMIGVMFAGVFSLVLKAFFV